MTDSIPCDEPGCEKTFESLVGFGMHKLRAHGPNAGWSTKRKYEAQSDAAASHKVRRKPRKTA